MLKISMFRRIGFFFGKRFLRSFSSRWTTFSASEKTKEGYGGKEDSEEGCSGADSSVGAFAKIRVGW